jgi:hypothetical protein
VSVEGIEARMIVGFSTVQNTGVEFAELDAGVSA